MYFIAIIITFCLLQYWGSFSLVQHDNWFAQLLDKARAMMTNPWLIYTVSVLFPCLLLVSILVVFRDRAYGLVSLLLAILILMYSLGRVAYSQLSEEYRQLWRAADYEKLPQILGMFDQYRVAEPEKSLQRLHVNIREACLYAGFQGQFAVLFWFFVLGPAGALLYRLNTFFVAKDGWIISKNIQALLEWPPACLSSLAFALMGDFDKGIPVWRDTAFNLGVTSKNMIHANGLAALNLDMEWLKGDFLAKNTLEQQAALADEEINNIVQLLRRTLVFAILVIAIVQMLA